jgi:CheY-like chemotaxis protein
MTNEAFSSILEHLCNEARNSTHATLGVVELLRDVAMDTARQASMAIGTASADQLLRSIDDVRDLLSSAPPAPAALEEFDVALCTGEIVDVLNLASGRRARRIVLEAPSQPVLVTQNRKAVEQVFTRILNTAFKLAKTSEIHVKLSPRCGEGGVRLAVTARDADLAARLTTWLNANPDQVVLQDPGDVPFGVAVMVAGKHMRALGGSAELVRDAAEHSAVALDIPSQTPRTGSEDLATFHPEPQLDALNILIAEDCDESFALSELLFRNENVWRARDGWEALRIIQKRRFDIVFMDVHMPGMDGYSAIRSIRDWETQTSNARTPVVILSSDDLDMQRRSAAQCGCSGFLRKPLRGDDLINLLLRLKESRRPEA